MTGRERQQQTESGYGLLFRLIAATISESDPDAAQALERAAVNVEEMVRDNRALAARLSGLQDTLAKLDKATTALRMIEENERGESWSAGVAMSALSAMEEVGYPKPHPRPDLFGPYTMGVKLCDDDGIVRSGRFHSGTDYPCTGHAHFAGEHIECTSPAHRAALALNTDGEATEP